MKLAYGHELDKQKHQDISVSMETRLRSMYAVGSSGSGKSSWMAGLIHQDIHDDVGFALFDVEDRLSDLTLRYLCDAGKKPVVIDPSIGPVPLNILDVPPGIHPHTVIEGVLQAFRRAWFDAWGPRLEDLLRHSLMALVEAKLTFGELVHFLSNQAFRERVAELSEDDRVHSYFIDHLRNVPAREWRTWVESTRNKVAAFADNPFIGPCLSTDKCIDFLEIMDSGTPVVINLSEKTLGDSGKLLGMLLVSRLYQAALRRAPGARPFIVYADEFQNIASRSFTDLVTRSRKRGVGSVVAHQTTHQAPFADNPDFLSAILANTAVHVVMQVGREDAERFAKEIFPVSGTAVKRRQKHPIWGEYGEPKFYSVQEEREMQFQELETQLQRECFIKLKEADGTRIYVAEAYETPEPISTEGQAHDLASERVRVLGMSLEDISASHVARVARFSPSTKLSTGRPLRK